MLNFVISRALLRYFQSPSWTILPLNQQNKYSNQWQKINNHAHGKRDESGAIRCSSPIGQNNKYCTNFVPNQLLMVLELADDCYTKPVGVSDQSKIPDDHMTASSQFNNGYQAAYGRLNGDRGDGWCTKEAESTDDWLQVDLGTTSQVCAVATQGDVNGNDWVTDFKLSYPSDESVWTPYKDAAGVEMVSSALRWSLLYEYYIHY